MDSINFQFDFKDLSKKSIGRDIISQYTGIPVPPPSLAVEQTFMDRFNEYIIGLQPDHRKLLFTMKPNGIGPGELACYFLYDNIGVGGKNSPIDLYLDDLPFAEVKAGKVLKNAPNTCRDFKVSTDGDPAVRKLLNNLDLFNKTYTEITGTSLPGWRGAEEIKINSLLDYSKINLSSLAATTHAKGVLSLEIDRDSHLNAWDLYSFWYNGKEIKVRPDTTIEDILSMTSQVTVNKTVETINSIVSEWSKSVCQTYLTKPICLMDSTNQQMKYHGMIVPEMLGLQYTHRQQPWAIITVPGESH